MRTRLASVALLGLTALLASCEKREQPVTLDDPPRVTAVTEEPSREAVVAPASESSDRSEDAAIPTAPLTPTEEAPTPPVEEAKPPTVEPLAPTPTPAVPVSPPAQAQPPVKSAAPSPAASPPVAPAPAAKEPAASPATPAPTTPAPVVTTREPATPAATATPSGTSAAPQPAPSVAPAAASAQLRGLWVDAFGPGLKTPEQIDRLIEDARRMRVNVLFAQIGKRGDCYCNHASMPRTDDPEVPAGFDPLQDLLDKAHAAGIQVHAWIITTSIVNVADNPAPRQADHVFNTHGLSATGEQDWLMRRADGEARAGNDYLLDPGHPRAAEYIAEMYLSVVRNYDVDGVQLDRIRYPDVSGTPDWGYNAVAVERYRAESGVSGTPDPNDPQWAQWRRAQITNLVRRIYLGVKAIKPHVWVDVATITYGPGPRSVQEFQTTRTYREVLQDWPEWTRQGYLDLNVLMNYKRDDHPEQARWYAQWNDFARTFRGVSRVAAGSAMYLNTAGGTLRQASQALTSGLDGWVGYSYRTGDSAVNAGTRDTAQAVQTLTAQFTAVNGPFAKPRQWGQPDTRALRGIVGEVTSNSGPLGGRRVEIHVNGRPFARTETDGGGQYGFVFTPPGEFEVRVENAAPLRVNPAAGVISALPVVELP